MPRCSEIRMIVFDVDGVLTDGRINLDDDGREFKQFHVRDGTGMKTWTALGHELGLLTGRGGGAVLARARELNITRLVEGSEDKAADVGRMAQDAGVPLHQVAYMGDDLIDIPAMRACGYAMAPADAVAEVQTAADFITRERGGCGAAREAIEHLLRARGEYERMLERYRV